VCNSVAFSIFTKLCVHHFWFQNILITWKRNPHVHRNHFPCLSPCQTLTYLLFLCVCMLWKCHKNGVIQHKVLLFRCSYLLHNCFQSSHCCNIYQNLIFLSYYSIVWLSHFVHQLVFTWIVSTFWLASVMLLWTFLCKFLWGSNIFMSQHILTQKF
jgi:hypothetical protein